MKYFRKHVKNSEPLLLVVVTVRGVHQGVFASREPKNPPALAHW